MLRGRVWAACARSMLRLGEVGREPGDNRLNQIYLETWLIKQSLFVIYCRDGDVVPFQLLRLLYVNHLKVLAS